MQIIGFSIFLVALVIGLLLLISPTSLIMLAKKANSVIFKDSYFIEHSLPTGVILLIIGTCLLFVYAIY